MALLAASSMWRMRTTSRGGSAGIEHLGLTYDRVPELRTQRRRGVQVHAPAEECGQLVLQGDEGEAGHMPGLELDQHVEIAVRAEVVGAQHRAEQGQPADMVLLTEAGERPVIHRDTGWHACSSWLILIVRESSSSHQRWASHSGGQQRYGS